MKLISWNVNGLRACVTKGFEDFFAAQSADVFCLQETKLQKGQIDFAPEGYSAVWNYAEKKGYSGTAVFTKETPLSVKLGLVTSEGELFPDTEGRAITVELEHFYLLCMYVPNAQRELTRLPLRMDWEDAVRAYVAVLQQKKPVVLCGDLNVAHQEIDLKNPKTNHNNAGFTDEERGKMTALLQENAMLDTFRVLYPDKADAYTWWSYIQQARAKDVGWRIDYFLCSASLKGNIKDALIYKDVPGSDHCPIGLELEF